MMNEMSVRCLNREAKTMKKFRIICPDCGAGFIVDKPEALVWERCPQCRTHVWDLYDALMADKVPVNPSSGPEAAAMSN